MCKRFFRNVLRSIFPRRDHLASKLQRRPRFESLDTRQLLAADLAVADATVVADEVNGAVVALELFASGEAMTVASVNHVVSDPANPHDANHDGVVNAVDVDILMASLNRGEGGRLPIGTIEGESSPWHPDVSGDGFFSPMDALQVINYLNETESALATTDCRSPFTNSDNALDVDGSGSVTSEDATVILADIAARGARNLGASHRPLDAEPYLDVNCDGFVSPSDVLQIANFLNDQDARGKARSSPTVDPQGPLMESVALSELEPLLDELIEGRQADELDQLQPTAL